MTTAPTILSHVGDLLEIADQLGGATVVPIPREGELPQEAQGTILFTMMKAVPNLPQALDRGVTWVHTIGTGVDEFPLELLGDRMLTCSRGANAIPIAEWVLAQMLTLEKRLPEMWVTEPPETWGGTGLGGVQGATVAVLGFGSIGTAVAQRALAFEANVRALRRSATPSPIPGVELVTDPLALVQGADHVVLAAPATNETRGIVDETVLRAMKPGAHLINVSRDSLVNEAALREALDSGHLACASIDVAPVEPLPAGHWFYEHPRVRFSPHVSWSGPGVWEEIQNSFITNYRLWTTGQPLQNVVNRDSGY